MGNSERWAQKSHLPLRTRIKKAAEGNWGKARFNISSRIENLVRNNNIYEICSDDP